jgi:hypothetical protein
LGRSVLTDRRGQFRFSDLPVGPHLVAIRAVGYQPYLGSVQLDARRAIDQKVLMPRAAQSLAAVEITGAGVPREFDERRELGLGAFLTQKDIEAFKGLRLGTVMAQVKGFGSTVSGFSGGAHAYVVGKRAPSHLLPKSVPANGANGARGECGAPMVRAANGQMSSVPCTFAPDDLARQGYYCPTRAEQLQGLSQCACFAQVYMDDRLMNSGKPTEPFDVNTIPSDLIAGLEFYATPASTPARYSQLDAVCGVMLVWTKRR